MILIRKKNNFRSSRRSTSLYFLEYETRVLLLTEIYAKPMPKAWASPKAKICKNTHYTFFNYNRKKRRG